MNITSVKRIHQSDWRKKGIPFYRARDITALSKNLNIEEPIFISRDLYEEYSKISGKVQINDLLVTGVGTIGVPLLVQTVPLYFKDGNIIWFQNSNKLIGLFFLYLFKTNTVQKYIHTTTGVGTVPTYTIQSGKNTPVYITSKKEQKDIGTIFQLIDNLISLQQRKLTELQLLRTSLNQQLLKDNSSWKSVKLREILNIRNKQIFPNQQYPLMSFVQKQGVVPKSQRYNRDFLVKGNKKYKVTEKGDFIYSSNNLETGSIGINKTGNATISPVYSVFSSKNYKESLFIGLLSEKKSFIYKMIRFRQGVVYGQWKIPEKDFLNIKIKIPNYQEQEKIITLFTHIDNQFKQENKKLTDLQNFKQFLLQNMFI